MANGAMIYKGEQEEISFNMASPNFVYTFTKVYNKVPRIVVDNYDGIGINCTHTATLTECTVSAETGKTGHITVIE